MFHCLTISENSCSLAIKIFKLKKLPFFSNNPLKYLAEKSTISVGLFLITSFA